MMYDERLISPMRQELTRLGFEETRSVEQLDAALGNTKGTVLAVVNSVCGCAAGMMRPAVALAVQNGPKPDKMITVFAGNDREATQRLREHYLVGVRPSSPSIALFQDGKLVKMIERWQIEGREPEAIADELMTAFEQYCSKATA